REKTRMKKSRHHKQATGKRRHDGGHRRDKRTGPQEQPRVPVWEQHYAAGRRAKAQGKVAKAEKLFTAALRAMQEHGGMNVGEATYLNALAVLYGDQDRQAEAEPLLERALAIAESHLGAEHPDLFLYLRNLGACYSNRNKCAEAEQYLRRAVTLRESCFGVTH